MDRKCYKRINWDQPSVEGGCRVSVIKQPYSAKTTNVFRMKRFWWISVQKNTFISSNLSRFGYRWNAESVILNRILFVRHLNRLTLNIKSLSPLINVQYSYKVTLEPMTSDGWFQLGPEIQSNRQLFTIRVHTGSISTSIGMNKFLIGNHLSKIHYGSGRCCSGSGTIVGSVLRESKKTPYKNYAQCTCDENGSVFYAMECRRSRRTGAVWVNVWMHVTNFSTSCIMYISIYSPIL